jgi:hypothetical protein
MRPGEQAPPTPGPGRGPTNTQSTCNRRDGLLMRTTSRMLAASALSLPLALGAAGVAAADTEATVEVSEDPVAATQFQDQDRSAHEQRNAEAEARTTDEDDGLVIDLNTDLLGGDDFDGQDDHEDDGILGGILSDEGQDGTEDDSIL